MGLAALVLGARAGLKVSAEQLLRISIMVALIMSLEHTVMAAMFLVIGHSSEAARFITWKTGAQGIAIGLLFVSAGLIVRASFAQKDYPWRILRWTFSLAAVALVSPTFVDIARTSTRNRFAWFIPLIFALPVLLQAVLLWFPRRSPGEPPPHSDLMLFGENQ